jgi:hypothetical protein
MLPGPGYLARPSFPRPSGAETDTQAQETLVLGDPLGSSPAMPAMSCCNCSG